MIVTLASNSPRRRELIKQLGFSVIVQPSGADENISESNPEKLVTMLALKKAQSVFDNGFDNVIGADTIVVLDGKVLGKPKTENEAFQMLKSLCGKTHKVITGLALVSKKGSVCDYETTFVTFGQFNEDLIRKYVASKSPMDKAGAYGIQDQMLAPIVEKVDGDLENVIGLPVKKLKTLCAFFED